MSESPPKYRRNARNKVIKKLVRQHRIQLKRNDLRKRITAIYKAESSFDEENNEEINVLPIPEINNKSILLETSSSELSTRSDTSNYCLLENTRENLLKKLVSERKKAVKKAEEKNVKLLTAHSQLQSSSQEQFKSNYVKNPCASENIKSPKKNVLQELYDNAKIKAKEKIKKPESSMSFAGTSKTSSCTSENQSTSLSFEEHISIASPSKVSDISRKSDDLEFEEYNQINPPFHSPMKDTSLFTKEESSPFSSRKKKLDPPVHNLTKDLNASEQAVINRPPNLPPLPLNDIKRLEEFEKFISKDVNLSAACYYFKTLVLENEEKTAVSKLMTKLMTNSLAIHFNFDGQNPQNTLKIKRSFKQLKLWELVQGVILIKFPNSDLSETLTTVRNWLRNAAWRKQ
ncbi:uncharacterized protein LOC105204903 isoform X2 [Solenopsis invicta]|uniref:uncharacterized protein LOC105204903 isoform X2 n=1 Tax=Solenopsis invicta TaxID=13686 RepID=UPI00193DF93F|nr:uncharacterized protein LOC105204903 isoform X2 [Solenopsis invicta]